MSMYTLKSIARRGTLLGAVGALVVAAIVPAAPAFADALNPLTERSLLLSSSAPGYQNTDGSGNSEAHPNAHGDEFAPPGSGPNGMKTGETFSFNVSTDSSTGTAIKGFSLQYCTEAAGLCKAPGNNTGDTRTAGGSDRETNTAAIAAGHTTSDLDVVGTFTVDNGAAGTPVPAGKFRVVVNGTTSAATDWAMTTVNKEDTDFNNNTPGTGLTGLTGTNNFVKLASPTGITPATGQNVQIIFQPSSSVYITNPGTGAFFVKMNTYKTDDAATKFVDTVPSATNTDILDGGVTVANVMTDSIHITTKVLETMAFSVGTINPDTKNQTHGSCDPITTTTGNRLSLGDPNAESSLKTTTAYDTASYWRLSSNSSGGATVYYSGNTLANTVGDEIAPIGPTKAHSHLGTEQFGLAVVNPTAGSTAVDGTTTVTGGANVGDTMDAVNTFPGNHVTPKVQPLVVEANYAGGDVPSISDATDTNNAEFAFEKESNTIPKVIAQEGSEVLSCATAKMRYVANIAADTPAGVYTTKINYLAAPQY